MGSNLYFWFLGTWFSSCTVLFLFKELNLWLVLWVILLFVCTVLQLWSKPVLVSYFLNQLCPFTWMCLTEWFFLLTKGVSIWFLEKSILREDETLSPYLWLVMISRVFYYRQIISRLANSDNSFLYSLFLFFGIFIRSFIKSS